MSKGSAAGSMEIRSSVDIEFLSPVSAGPLARAAVWMARNGLLAFVLVVYSGAFLYLITISPALLYGSYVVVSGLCATILFLEKEAARKAFTTAPYLCWVLVVYCAWGSLVTVGRLDETEVAKAFLKNAVVLSAFSLAAADLNGLRKAACGFQFVILLNVGICICEMSDQNLIVTLARTVDAQADAFDVLRPAGLWRNPDEAAFAFIFGFCIAKWAPRPIALIGRLAAVAGVFMTVSRTGAYILFVSSIMYLVYRIFTRRLSLRWLGILSLALAVAAGIVLILVGKQGLLEDVRSQRQLRRLFDPAEHSDRAAGSPTRLEIAIKALDRAMERPLTGFGIFTFENNQLATDVTTGLALTPHNVFVLVFGETGILGLLTYLAILGWGICRIFSPEIVKADRFTLGMMWVSYLIIAFAWHNQFDDFGGMLYAAMLYHLPALLRHEQRGINNRIGLC